MERYCRLAASSGLGDQNHSRVADRGRRRQQGVPHRRGEAMLSPADRFSYALRQSARIAWYMGHYFASQRFRAKPADETEEHRPRRQGGLSRETILAAMGRLFARDLANVERGFYPVPRDRDGDLRGLI